MKKILFFFIFFGVTTFLTASDSQTFTKAEKYLKEGKIEIALLFYTKELNVNFDNWKAYYHRGKIYFYQNQFKQALSDFEKAYQIYSKDAGLVYFLGNAYASTGDTDKAIKFYKKSLKMDSDNNYAYLNLGIVYLKQKKDKKNTIKNWKTFLKKEPNYYQKEDIRKAIAYLESDDFSFDALENSNVSSTESSNNTSTNSNTNKATSDDKLVIPDILIPDIKGEGKKAPVSKHKGSEGPKGIETE